MNLSPYRSETKNIQKETATTLVPTTINNNSVFIKQTGFRTIEDTITTEILPNPINPFTFQSNSQNMYANPFPLPGGGVVFTFPNTQVQSTKFVTPSNNFGQARPPTVNFCQQENDVMRMNYELAAKKLEEQTIANMLNPLQPREIPYRLTFHQNEATSTADLNPTPQQCCCGTETSDFEMIDICSVESKRDDKGNEKGSSKNSKNNNNTDKSDDSSDDSDSSSDESSSCACSTCECDVKSSESDLERKDSSKEDRIKEKTSLKSKSSSIRTR